MLAPMLLGKFVSRLSGRARAAYIALLVAVRLVGGALAVYGWRLGRRALRERQARRQGDADIASPS